VPDKLEVLQGPGLVARFGEVAVWAGPQATAALQAHLITEAQRAQHSPTGGEQLASSLIAVLQRGDPEPHAPFAIVGPGSNGLALFLHGPVQAWDSGRWLAPQPVPGWLVSSIGRPWPLIIMPYGASPPPQSQQGNPLDLLAGAVPGSGFVLLRPPTAPAQQAGPGQFGGAQQAGPGQFGGAQQAGPGQFGGAQHQGGPGQAASVASPAQGPQGTTAPAWTEPAPPALSGQGTTSGAPVDLRNVLVPSSPPLPTRSQWAAVPAANRPAVQGLRCPRGHFNHPRAAACSLCGLPLAAGTPQVSGPRPPIGILLADDGSIWALDRGCLIGAEPETAAELQGSALQAIAMKAGPNHTMAAVQAEVQVRGWSAFLVDRAAAGGTFVQGPAAKDWVQLSPGEQRELPNGSHLSCGGRVLTYLSAWPA